MVHEIPFHFSMSVPWEDWPTAQHCNAEVHVTALKMLSCVALVLGEAKIHHPLGSEAKLTIASRAPPKPRMIPFKMCGLKLRHSQVRFFFTAARSIFFL